LLKLLRNILGGVNESAENNRLVAVIQELPHKGHSPGQLRVGRASDLVGQLSELAESAPSRVRLLIGI
jgi:hypothetical protein